MQKRFGQEIQDLNQASCHDNQYTMKWFCMAFKNVVQFYKRLKWEVTQNRAAGEAAELKASRS